MNNINQSFHQLITKLKSNMTSPTSMISKAMIKVLTLSSSTMKKSICSTVKICTKCNNTNEYIMIGNGFILNYNNKFIIITNKHVIDNCNNGIFILSYNGEVLEYLKEYWIHLNAGEDEFPYDDDLVVTVEMTDNINKIDEFAKRCNIEGLSISNIKCKIEDEIKVTKYSLLQDQTPHIDFGKISGISKDGLLRISGKYLPTNSGAPLLNKDGEVVGVTVVKSDNDINVLKIQVKDIINSGIFVMDRSQTNQNNAVFKILDMNPLNKIIDTYNQELECNAVDQTRLNLLLKQLK